MIPLYKAEIEAGLKDQLVVASTQAICKLQVEIPELIQKRLGINLKERVERAFGASSDSFDLFSLYTILVSTGWNKNDDVFGRLETWKAKYTPEDKPFNLEHNPSKIIGHITASCPIDEQFLPIEDDIIIDDLPNKYHILTSAVIYQPVNQRDREWSLELAKIIDEIKQGEWCVSMECLFNDFDYAVADAEGKQSIVNRNEDTAFLTKHLRMYGGQGSFQDKKLGRYLKNITFSGKGLVKKPANPDSVIFTDTEMFSGVFASVYNFQKNGVNNSEQQLKENDMADEKVATLEQENINLKSQIADLNEKVKVIEESQKKVDELTNIAKTKDEEIVKISENVIAKDNEITVLKTENETLKTSKAEVEKKYTEAEDKISSLSLSLTRANRTVSLYQYDISPEEVKNIVDKFISVADEQFNEMVLLIAEKKKKKDKKDGEMPPDGGCASATEVIDSAIPTPGEIPANSSAAPTVTKIEKAKADLQEYFGQLINTKKKTN